MAQDWRNKLFFGDNLRVLREEIADESVDLIYLDPPFNSKADYNVLYKNQSGEDNAAQAHAFKDTWEWDEAAAEAYHELMTRIEIPTNLKNLMAALKVFLTGDTGKKGNSMMAYITMMALRLVELHRVLKPTGSLYLHCDPTASHYIKLVLDAVFGAQNFKNEISWERTNAHNVKSRHFARIRDVIFYYTRDNRLQAVWNEQYIPYEENQLKEYRQDADGRWYTTHDLTFMGGSSARKFEWRGVTPPANRCWGYSQEKLEELLSGGLILLREDGKPRMRGLKVFLDERPGKRVTDQWTDVGRIGNTAGERLGYPTQKPEGLLQRIIQTSSNEGDLILDPFCGCGTTIAVADKLNRRWIGIDVTYVAVDLMERRLIDIHTSDSTLARLADIPVQKRRHAMKTYWAKGEDELMIGLQPGLKPFEVLGVPETADDARFLFQNDPYQFEWWAIGMMGAQGKEFKKGADRGIDGIITFGDKAGDYERAVISVKGGKLNSPMIRDLQGTMTRENAVVGVLVTNEEPTGPMKKEAADAGRWNSKLHPDRSYPCIQILTAAEILAGKVPDIPRWSLDNFKKAAKAKATIKQDELFE